MSVALPSRRRTGLRFEPSGATQGAAQLHLRAQDREQALVVPGLLDEIAGASAHRLDRHVHRAPRRHHDHREHRIAGMDLPEQLEPLLARRRVARVVEVDQDDVVVALAERCQRRRRRLNRVNLVTLPLEQQTEGFEDIALIVGDEDAWRSRRHGAKLSLS